MKIHYFHSNARLLPLSNIWRGFAPLFCASWGNEDTQQLIDILKMYGVKTTFFVVGDWVDRFPESVKALHDAGHEVMNHSNSHPYMSDLSYEQMVEEVEACNDKIEAITGVRPHLTRVPYGDYNDEVVETLRELGQYTIQWDVDSLDWQELSAKEIFDRVTGKVQNGAIVLFHNAAQNTPSALPLILEKLQADGYEIVPISELIYEQSFIIDHSGRQIQTQQQAAGENAS